MKIITCQDFIEKCLYLRNESGEKVPFMLRPEQKLFLDAYREDEKKRGYVRLIVLKARQVGISYMTLAINFFNALRQPKSKFFIMAHKQDTAKHLLDRIKELHENMSPEMQVGYRYNNAMSIELNNGSQFMIGVSTPKADTGKGFTLQHFHGSELADFPDAQKQVNNVSQCIVGQKNTSIILESTARGYNAYKNLWDNAIAYDNFTPVFIPYYIVDKYKMRTDKRIEDFDAEAREQAKLYNLTAEQLEWRANKILTCGSIEAFNELYPAHPELAFVISGKGKVLIELSAAVEAQRRPVPLLQHNNRVMGVDFASGEGADASAIVIRNDDIIEYYRLYPNMPMEVFMDEVVRLTEAYNVKRVFADADGLGMQPTNILRKTLGEQKVIKVRNGKSAKYREAYGNVRAENWVSMANWIKEYGVLPASDALITQLVNVEIRSRQDIDRRLFLESKKDMKKRGLPSPDLADALAMTFHQSYNASDQEITIPTSTPFM